MSHATDTLVERLAREAAPVRRLRPPGVRAALWLGAFGGVAVFAILAFANLSVFMMRVRHPELLVELAGTLATGILATVAAFHLSVPDRSSRWALLPLPTLAIWIVGSGAGCYRQWLVLHDRSWRLGESGDCLMFILGFGTPLALALMLTLRRAHTLTPLSVAATGGLGAAALAAFLLQFFHPFDVTLMDLVVHAVAVSAVVTACRAGGGRLLART